MVDAGAGMPVVGSFLDFCDRIIAIRNHEGSAVPIDDLQARRGDEILDVKDFCVAAAVGANSNKLLQEFVFHDRVLAACVPCDLE